MGKVTKKEKQSKKRYFGLFHAGLFMTAVLNNLGEFINNDYRPRILTITLNTCACNVGKKSCKHGPRSLRILYDKNIGYLEISYMECKPFLELPRLGFYGVAMVDVLKKIGAYLYGTLQTHSTTISNAYGKLTC